MIDTKIISNSCFENSACLDTGSFLNLISKSLVEKNNVNSEPHYGTISGIENKTLPILGTFECTVAYSKGFVKNVIFHIIDSKIPVILGLQFLNHESIESFSFSKNGLTLNRIINDKKFQNKIAFSNDTFAFKSLTVDTSLELSRVQMINNVLGVSINPMAKVNEINELSSLLLQYRDVFGKDGNSELGLYPGEVPIDTVKGKAEAVRQHPLPAAYKEGLNNEIARMLKMDIIEDCKDPKGWNSPILPVKKKNGDIRLCCNFKKTVNLHLSESSDKFQLPCAETLFHEIGQSNRYFGSLDVKAGYWQLRIKESDRHKTAFQYGNRCYQFRRLPFGLKSSGDFFCRAISTALQDIKNIDNIKNFVDDILIHSVDFDNFIKSVCEILAVCRKYNIRLNGEKCKFLFPNTKFLGRILNQNGYQADPDNVQAIKAMKPPRTRRELQVTIGRMNWSRIFLFTNKGEPVADFCFSGIIKEFSQLNKKNA